METDSLTGRLVAAGELLKRARMGARYSQQRLAAEAGIGVRTVWRIEHGVQGDLPTYEAIAVVLGFPPDWYLRAASLLDPEALEASGEAAADRLIDSAVVTGWLGPSALTFLREFLAFGRDHGGASGALEALAVGFRDNLERRAASMLRDPRR